MNLIIDFKQGTAEADIEQYLKDHGCSLVKVYDNFELVYLVSAKTKPPVTEIVDSIIDDTATPIKLLGETIVSDQYYGLFNPNLPVVSFTTTEDKDWWKNYQLMDPDFSAPTITINRKGAPGSVYIMDSGIDAAHPEFAKSNIVNLFSFTGEFNDTNGHGTALASLVAGETCSVGNATVKVVKVFDDAKETHQSDLLSALDAVLSDFMINPSGLGILNCSWSIPHNEYIEAKMKTLMEAGIFIVVSAGNNGLPITDVTPAAMPDVLTIGSYGKDLKPSDFSNYTGSSVISYTANETNHGALDGWAPGEQIWVAVPGGTYGWAAGTSLSAAIHSATLAYNMSRDIEDGVLFPFIQKQSQKYIAYRSLNREKLLDVSDEKYVDSAGTISTLYPNFERPQEDPVNFLVAATVGVPFVGIAFNPQKTKSATFADPLPYGFKINNKGVVYGQVDSLATDYEVFETTLTVVTLDDVEHEVNFKLGFVKPDFDTSTLPEDDPIVQMTLEYCQVSNCNSYCLANGWPDGGYCPNSSKTVSRCCSCFNLSNGTSNGCGV